MCGIVAYLNFDPNNTIDKTTLGQMTGTLAHRGPDDSGLWCNGSVGLGHRRLAIIDLSPAGRGPMTNADGSLVITFNGEIYNYRELRPQLEAKGYRFQTQTDTEVILHAYAEWGTGCLEYFNGMFAFALWDARRQRLFVARDRFGIKPLIYYCDADRFICASELKAVVAANNVPRNLDPMALHHYLSLMNIPAPFTIYQDIHKLRPGHYLLIENGQVREERWWNLPLGTETTESEPVILEKLESLLQDSIRLRLISDAPLGTFLSGGVDSSIISAIAAQQAKGQKLATFSVTFSGQAKYDERRYSRQVTQHINSTHTEIDLQVDFLEILPEVVDLFDEPFAVSSALAIYLMARETTKHVKVILTGDGGDEVFAGYPFRHTRPDNDLDKLARLPFSNWRTFKAKSPQPLIAWELPTCLRRARLIATALTTPDVKMRTWRYLQTLFNFNEAEKFALYSPEWAEHLRQSANFSSTDEFLMAAMPASAPNRLARWLYFDIHTTLVNEMLAKVDKATMAWGLEARTPFLDHRLVTYALTIPAHLMAQGTNGKRLLKQLGERYVPHEVLYRKKQGFNVPLGAWLRQEVPPIFADALSSSRLKASSTFCPKVIEKIIARHRRDHSVDFSNRILSLAWFEMWQANG